MCKQISNLLLSPFYSDFMKSETECVNAVCGEADIAVLSWRGFDQLSDRVAGHSWLIRFVAGLSPLWPSVSPVIANLRGKSVAGAWFSSRISGFLWTLKLALFEAARHSLTHRRSWRSERGHEGTNKKPTVLVIISPLRAHCVVHIQLFRSTGKNWAVWRDTNTIHCIFPLPGDVVV